MCSVISLVKKTGEEHFDNSYIIHGAIIHHYLILSRDVTLPVIFSDVKVIIGTQTFYAHKNILAALSRYFAAMFESSMKEVEEGEIRITDIFANIMQEIFRFIYTGKINVGITMITDLFIVADMYGLDVLLAIYKEAIISNMILDNIGSILTYIERLNNAE